MDSAGSWKGYAWSLAAAAACTAAGFAMTPRFDLVNVAMVYLLAVVVIALRFTRGPAILTAVLSVAAFDFLFVPPQGTFTVHDAQYLLTFAIMLAVALVISGLTQSVRRQAAEQGRLAVQAETERIRSALLSSISHDLRTPLAVISGAASSLAESGENLASSERMALARSVFEHCREMSDHVEKILQMTRLETGAIAPQADWCSIDEIASSVLERLRGQLAAHRVIVEIPGDAPIVKADAVLIGQALTNLLENAAKHTPPDTCIRLRVAARESELEVSVEDFGGELPVADLERVFAKFERGGTEGATAGVGLGLSICRAIVALHRGRAWAESLPIGGKAFRFTLPLEPPPRAAAERAD